jgi:hypothetical protein
MSISQRKYILNSISNSIIATAQRNLIGDSNVPNTTSSFSVQAPRSNTSNYVPVQGTKQVKVMQAALKKAAKILTQATVQVDSKIQPTEEQKKNFKAFSDFFIEHFVGSQNPTLLNPIEKYPAGAVSVSDINAPAKVYEEKKQSQKSLDEVTTELNRIGTPQKGDEPEGVWGRRTQNNVRQILAVGYGLIELKDKLNLKLNPELISKPIIDSVTKELPKEESPYLSKKDLGPIADKVTDLINKILNTYIGIQNFFQKGDYAAILGGDKVYSEDKTKLNADVTNVQRVLPIEYSDKFGQHTITIQQLASNSDFSDFLQKNYPFLNKLSKDEKITLIKNIKEDINKALLQRKQEKEYNTPEYSGGATSK